jgi:hypothetical protein
MTNAGLSMGEATGLRNVVNMSLGACIRLLIVVVFTRYLMAILNFLQAPQCDPNLSLVSKAGLGILWSIDNEGCRKMQQTLFVVCEDPHLTVTYRAGR